MGETGFSREGLISLLAFLNPGLARPTRFCVASSVLDAAGMCVGRTDTGVGYFPSKLPEYGSYPLPPALPGSPDTVRGTGPSTEGPQLSKEKGHAALRCGPRAVAVKEKLFPWILRWTILPSPAYGHPLLSPFFPLLAELVEVGKKAGTGCKGFLAFSCSLALPADIPAAKLFLCPGDSGALRSPATASP